MNDNRSRDIFYGVVAVATLIIALVGATLAYFSISSSSDEGAVAAKAATVSINYEDGKDVIAQADELIPATWDVVKKVYEKHAEEIDTWVADGTTELEERPNVCVDDNEKEVCSIYRFSVSSDIERSIRAKLSSEANEFTWLAYAVRDVTNNTWLNLDGSSQTVALDKCEGSDGEIPCFSLENSNKTYLKSYSLLGYTGADNSELVTKTVAATPQIYDVLLFIKDTAEGIDQNVDQGKTYRGTIVVDVIDSGAGRVTGYVND